MLNGEKYQAEDIKETFLVHREYHPDGMNVRAHMHEHIEILYCFDGKYSMWLNSAEYDFGSGDMVVINAGEVHSIKSLVNGGNYICIRFRPELMYTNLTSALDMKYALPFTLNNVKHTKVFKKSELESTFIPQVAEEAYTEFINKDYGYEMAVKTAVSRIFLWIVRYWYNHNETKIYSREHIRDDMIEWLEKALEYVNENYSYDIKAAEVAKFCSLSYSYFTRVFKRCMKKSFSEYLCYVRITNAEKLLASTDMSITDIALRCGFSCSSYFIKQFREIKGVSPKRYRNEILR